MLGIIFFETSNIFIFLWNGLSKTLVSFATSLKNIFEDNVTGTTSFSSGVRAINGHSDKFKSFIWTYLFIILSYDKICNLVSVLNES